MPSLLNDKYSHPDASSLSELLGESRELWTTLCARLAAEGASQDWKFYGASLGWQLKVSKGKRAIVYLIPHEPGGFLAALALKGKALDAIARMDLPGTLKEEILNGKQFPEGRAARVVVRRPEDLECVWELAKLKL